MRAPWLLEDRLDDLQIAQQLVQVLADMFGVFVGVPLSNDRFPEIST